MNLICGINPVIEALGAGSRHFERLLVAKGVRNRRVGEAMRRASGLGIPLRFEARETLDRMAGGVSHQGLIAVVSAKETQSLETILGTARAPGLFLVLDGVEDPRNLGAILRTAEAAGVDGVLLPERHSAGLTETVAKASAGGLEHVKLARVGNVVQALAALKSRGVWVVGFDASGSERWDRVDYSGPVALVLGGEGRGIRRLVREHCDHLASLPLFGHVGSLNVSVAAGIALYEVIRQRGAEPSHVRPIPAKASHGERRVVGPPPDDGEDDPGARRRPREEAGEQDLDSEADSGPLVLLDDTEEPDWSGPTIQAVKERARGAGPSRLGGRQTKDRRRRGRQQVEARPTAPPEVTSPAQTERAQPAPGEAGGRRRRRRGQKPGEGSLPAAASAAPRNDAGDSRPPAASEAPTERAPGGTGGPPPGPQGSRRRRRRRKR